VEGRALRSPNRLQRLPSSWVDQGWERGNLIQVIDGGVLFALVAKSVAASNCRDFHFVNTRNQAGHLTPGDRFGIGARDIEQRIDGGIELPTRLFEEPVS
jgi:hypothetical protein